jgi:hypothetical protein
MQARCHHTKQPTTDPRHVEQARAEQQGQEKPTGSTCGCSATGAIRPRRLAISVAWKIWSADHSLVPPAQRAHESA